MSHMPRHLVLLAILVSLSPRASALHSSGGTRGRESTKDDAASGLRVVVQQHDAKVTGGPEALVQLLRAFQDIGAPYFYTGGVHKAYSGNEYKDLKLEGRLLRENELGPNDIYIIPELHRCSALAKGGRPYIWVLAKRNMGPDSCRRLSHNHFLAKAMGLNDTDTLTPYVTPQIVDHAKRSTGLEQDGSFKDLQSLLAVKEDLVLIDDDSHVSKTFQSESKSSAATDAGFMNKLVSELRDSHPNIRVVQISSLTDNDTFKVIDTRSASDPSGVIVHGMSREEVLDHMTRAKVVVDSCMRGSERMPIEASLHGAVAITDDCDTGSDETDFPVSRAHKVKTRSNMKDAIVKAVRDYPTEVMDEGQVALRKKYGSDIARASLAKEAQAFLNAYKARTVAQ